MQAPIDNVSAAASLVCCARVLFKNDPSSLWSVLI